jgi:acetate kinase
MTSQDAGRIAVLNAGSSSIKFALYQGVDALLFRGQIERIGSAPRLTAHDAAGKSVAERSWPSLDHRAATREIVRTVAELSAGAPVTAVGHRVVHGGTHYAAPVRIDADVLEKLAALIPLAPLHQPHNLEPIRAIAEHAPQLPQVACFDTAFHRSQAPVAQEFALPRKFSDEGVRRYGFHGLSYEYIAARLHEIAPALAAKRLIVAHLGNGASLCAVHRGRSVASTMGFTAVDGLVMGTRCGAIDPGVILYLLDQHHMDARAIEDLIYRRSGLLGVSGIASDMRTLRASPEPAAGEAIALFVYRIVREIGSLAAALGGLDGLVFTAGIGENDAATRHEVAAGCGWLGVELDAARNGAGRGRISAEASRVAVWVVPTDEERMIARHTVATLACAAG